MGLAVSGLAVSGLAVSSLAVSGAAVVGDAATVGPAAAIGVIAAVSILVFLRVYTRGMCADIALAFAGDRQAEPDVQVKLIEKISLICESHGRILP